MTLTAQIPKKIYIRVDEWRTPWANTILYLPLKDNINDATWNYTIIQSWTVSKWSIGYSFNNWMLKTSTSFAWPTAWTISVWAKQTQSRSNSNIAAKFQETVPYNFLAIKYWNPDHSGSSPYAIVPEYAISNSWPVELFNQTAQPLNTWLYLVMCHGNEWTKFYINGTLFQSDNNTSNLLTTSSPFVVGSNIQHNQYFIWEISDVIYESKQRTAQEVLDYYNDTKWDYWIS